MNETVVSTAANVTNINFLNTIIDFLKKVESSWESFF